MLKLKPLNLQKHKTSKFQAAKLHRTIAFGYRVLLEGGSRLLFLITAFTNITETERRNLARNNNGLAEDPSHESQSVKIEGGPKTAQSHTTQHHTAQRSALSYDTGTVQHCTLQCQAARNPHSVPFFPPSRRPRLPKTGLQRASQTPWSEKLVREVATRQEPPGNWSPLPVPRKIEVGTVEGESGKGGEGGWLLTRSTGVSELSTSAKLTALPSVIERLKKPPVRS